MDTEKPALPDGFSPLLRSLRIIVTGLVLGVVVFLGIALFLRTRGGEYGGGTGRALSYAAAGLLVFAVVARGALLAGLTAQGRRHIATGKWRDGSGVTAARPWQELVAKEGDTARLLALYQSRTVIGAAVLEAPGLFGCVAHLVEGGWIGPGVAIASVGLMLALHFPHRDVVAGWLADQARLLEEEREAAA